jgi:hypothetical protein
MVKKKGKGKTGIGKKITKKNAKRVVSNKLKKTKSKAVSKRKKIKYLLQDLKTKKKPDVAKFIEEHPKVENAIIKTAQVERKLFEKGKQFVKDYVQDVKTVAQAAFEALKRKPEEKLPSAKAEEVSQEKSKSKKETEQKSSFVLHISTGLYGKSVTLPPELVNQEKPIKVAAAHYESLEQNILDEILKNRKDLKPEEIIVSEEKNVINIEIKKRSETL